MLARAEKPLKGRTIANRAHVEYTSHFRTTLSRMVKADPPRVIKARQGGYWLPGRPVPPDEDGGERLSNQDLGAHIAAARAEKALSNGDLH